MAEVKAADENALQVSTQELCCWENKERLLGFSLFRIYIKKMNTFATTLIRRYGLTGLEVCGWLMYRRPFWEFEETPANCQYSCMFAILIV